MKDSTMAIISIPANPYHKAHKVTSLRQVHIEKQKEPISKILGVPFTPQEERSKVCCAANCLLEQIETNMALLKDDDSIKEI